MTPGEAISRVTEWVSAQGWKVKPVVPKKKGDHGFWCLTDSQTILTNPKVSDHIYLFSLLHECGHLVFSDPNLILVSSICNNRLVSRIKTFATFESGSKSVWLATIDEEFDAWSQAEILASTLGIPLDYNRFAKHRAWCLLSHIREGIKNK